MSVSKVKIFSTILSRDFCPSHLLVTDSPCIIYGFTVTHDLDEAIVFTLLNSNDNMNIVKEDSLPYIIKGGLSINYNFGEAVMYSRGLGLHIVGIRKRNIFSSLSSDSVAINVFYI